ncbi:MAG: hypothetical protein HOW97_03235 [Catenulispora sp.]|nr:hypothetical protein [Catenulispora sp.]NUR57245.1 hypothetical protein [Catenulispora sp.]
MTSTSGTIIDRPPTAADDAGWVFISNAAVVAAGLAAAQRQRTALMSYCAQIRSFHPMAVPAPLQTPHYTSAVMNARYLAVPADQRPSPQAIAEATAARAERKTLLEHGPDLHIIIGLGAVRAWHLDDPDVAAGQIRHLAEAAEAGSFRFGVLPDFARVPFPPSQGFTILDDDQVRVDHLTGELVLTAPEQVQAHADVFNELAAASVYGRDAQELLLAELQNVGALWRPEAPR